MYRKSFSLILYNIKYLKYPILPRIIYRVQCYIIIEFKFRLSITDYSTCNLQQSGTHLPTFLNFEAKCIQCTKIAFQTNFRYCLKIITIHYLNFKPTNQPSAGIGICSLISSNVNSFQKK